MIVRKGSLARHRRGDRCLDELGELAELRGRFGVHDALAGGDQYVFGGEYRPGGTLDHCGIGRQPGCHDWLIGQIGWFEVSLRDIDRDLEEDGPGRPFRT